MSVRSNHIISLLCITLGVALCAAYGGRLPSDTRARLITLKQLEKIPVAESVDQDQVSKTKVVAPQAPMDRLSQWAQDSALPFSLGCLFIIAGAILARANEKALLNAPTESQDTDAIDLGVLLTRIADRARVLTQDCSALSSTATESNNTEEYQILRDQIKDLLQGDLERLIDARARVRAQLGLTHYAELFGSVSQGERRLNRAWSALVDQHLPEALHSLQGAELALKDAVENFQDR